LAGTASVLVLVYFAYHYSWVGDRQFSNPTYAVLYYGLPLSAALVFFASLWLAPHIKINLVIALFASAVSLYALELFTEFRRGSTYASPVPVMTSFADSTDKAAYAAELSRTWHVPIDTRTATQVMAALSRNDVQAVPIITPSNHLLIQQPDGSYKSAVEIDGREVVPLAGISARPTVLCNEGGQWSSYQSDRHGFNNPDDVWQRDSLELAALGDSFVHGYCVPGDKNFVALIRQRYPATLNLGIAGNGPLLMLATLSQYLPAFRPRMVLWFYYEGNDLFDLYGEKKDAVLIRYLNEGFTQKALAQQDVIDRAILAQIPRLRALEATRARNRRENRSRVRLMNFLRLADLRDSLGLVGGVNPEEVGTTGLGAEDMRLFREVLQQAQRQTLAWDGRLIFVYLPEWARYTSYRSLAKTKHDEVLTVVRELGIPIVDLVPTFEVHGDPLSLFPFRWSGHYNELGHRLVAEAVLKHLDHR